MDFDVETELKKSNDTRKKVILSGLCKTLKEVDELTEKIQKSPYGTNIILSTLLNCSNISAKEARMRRLNG
jgi:hypothetical protein